MVNTGDMRLLKGVIFFFFLHISGTYAQDTLYGTISVKKNRKKIKSTTAYNYPKIDSKKKDAIKTEFMKYNEQGNIFIHYNYYNNTNETYDYDSSQNLTTVNVFNTYLRTYMYRDSIGYDEHGRMSVKVRFNIDKFQVGRRDVTPLPGSGAQNYVPEGEIFREEYKYDDSGKLIYKSNKRETQFAYFTYKYDSLGNEIEERAVNVRNRSISGKLVLDTQVVINTTKYDDYNNPITYTTTNTRGETLKSTINMYDAKGNKIESQVFDGAFQLRQKYKYTYDEWGNMTKQLYSDYRDLKGKPSLYSETKIEYEIEFY
jgi:hypothetical protein